MNRLLLLLTFFTFIQVGHTQVLNNQINAEIRMDEYYGNSDNDATSTDEQSMIITTNFMDAIGSLSPSQCVRFDCHVPCTQTENLNAPEVYYTWIRAWEIDTQVDFELHAWGDEGDNECIFDGDDQDEFMGTASNYNLSNNTIVNGRTPVEWHTDLGSANGWIFDNSTLYNLKPKVIWSYYAGAACSNPLDFGPIAVGESRAHINTNRSLPGVTLGGASIGYTNQISQFNDSPEAYYSFTLLEPAMINISTDNPGSNYDTFLGLQSAACGDIIATNDDTITSLFSSISTELEAGNYIIFVEGYAENQGDFELSITADAAVGTNDLNPELPVTLGPNPTDGLLNITMNESGISDDSVLEVHSLQGQLLLKKAITANNTSVDLSTYPAGTYLVRIITAEGQMTEKVVVY